jgi:hypothetical protein
MIYGVCLERWAEDEDVCKVRLKECSASGTKAQSVHLLKIHHMEEGEDLLCAASEKAVSERKFQEVE